MDISVPEQNEPEQDEIPRDDSRASTEPEQEEAVQDETPAQDEMQAWPRDSPQYGSDSEEERSWVCFFTLTLPNLADLFGTGGYKST